MFDLFTFNINLHEDIINISFDDFEYVNEIRDDRVNVYFDSICRSIESWKNI